jgi:hypothetical protein
LIPLEKMLGKAGWGVRLTAIESNPLNRQRLDKGSIFLRSERSNPRGGRFVTGSLRFIPRRFTKPEFRGDDSKDWTRGR